MSERATRLVLRWPDGTELYADIPPEQDVIDVLHDTTHEILARALGLARSPILQRQATGKPVLSPVEAGLEEAAVLALQALARYRWNHYFDVRPA